MKNKLNKTTTNNEAIDAFMKWMQWFKWDFIAEDITNNMTIVGSAKLERISWHSIIVEGDLYVDWDVDGIAYVSWNTFIKWNLWEKGDLIKETPGTIEIEWDLIWWLMVSEGWVIKVKWDIPNAVVILNNWTLEYKNKSYIVGDWKLTIRDLNEDKEVTVDIKIDTVTNLVNVDFSKNQNQIDWIEWFVWKNNEVMFNEDNFWGVVDIIDWVYVVSIWRYNFKEEYSNIFNP